MADNMNKVIMQGNLTRDPECRDLEDNKVCKISIASNRERGGEKETCFIDAYCWRGLAGVVEQYLHKGSGVLVEGRIKFDTWVTKDTEEKRQKHVIVVEKLVMLDKKGSRDEG